MRTGTMKDLFDGRKAVDFTVDGRCSGCGNCCSNILPLSDVEVVRIRRYIREHGIKEQRKVQKSIDGIILMRGTFFGNKDDLAIYEAVEKGGKI